MMHRLSRQVLSLAIRRRSSSILAYQCCSFSNCPSIIQNKTYSPALNLNVRNYSSSSGGSSSSNDPGGNDDTGALTLYGEDQGSLSPPQKVPDYFPNVPIIAINRYPLFPGFIKRIEIRQDDALKKLIKRKMAMQQPYVGLFVKKDNDDKSESVSSLSQIYNVGTFANIEEIHYGPPTMTIIVNAYRRIRILEPLEEDGEEKPTRSKRPYKKRDQVKVELPNDATMTEGQERRVIYAKTENIVTEPIDMKAIEIKALMQTLVQAIKDVANYSQLFTQQVHLMLHAQQQVIENPIFLCDLVATLVQDADTEELQAIMQETNVKKRLDLALTLMEKEKTIVKLRHEISKDVEKKVHDQHRKYLLNEQLKAIKKELGLEKDDKQTITEKMEERLKELKVPEYAMKVISEEQAKMSFLDPHSSEFSVSRNYLDWLTSVPWGKTSEENSDLRLAKKILEEDHYGMNDVKDRILEFIAVSILKKSITGKILCFYGPPGVGKTSIARSIARALNRQYYRFSVGGLYDVAEIKGHRRTYIGAMPGKMIQCLKKVQTENPLVLIDEVDKMGGAGYHGDPASALLELLDPEQNANFLDHFLDVPVDLSKVLFICTANTLDTIPGALKDRMETIEVSGYVAEEKVKIADNYLIPQCREKCALTEDKIIVKDEAIDTMIKHYCRESGVRNLQKQIEKVFRKVAYKIALDPNDQPLPIVIENSNLKEFIGREKFTSDRLYDITPPGVIMGLAWTSMGGSALFIEASLTRRLAPKVQQDQNDKDRGSLEATGHLGDVMKESMRTAYTVAKNTLMRKDLDNDFLERAHIHVHVPEGATPKDGPSAGCTIVSALLSLALQKPAIQQLAMTGEISLTGKVLPVGGIKEKVIAAKRAGVDRVILPRENEKDFEDLDDFIKKDINVHFVSNYDEVFELIFPSFQSKDGDKLNPAYVPLE